MAWTRFPKLILAFLSFESFLSLRQFKIHAEKETENTLFYIAILLEIMITT